MSASAKLKTNIVNGICVDDVHGLIESINADPAKAMTQWRVANAWRNQMLSTALVDGCAIGGEQIRRPFAFDIDEPLQLAGANTAANPQEYLLGALNACLVAGFTALCSLHGYALEKLDIVTEGDIDLRGFLGLDASVSPGYDALTTTVTVKGSASPDEFRQIFDMVLATSPNLHNITRPIALTPKLDVVSNR